MPELPEVECWGRRVAERSVVGKQIEKVWTERDPIVYDGVAPRTFAQTLKGRSILAACRKGKQLWFEMDQGPSPLFHFGMSGSFVVYEDAADRPRFAKVELLMDDGTRLAMPDARRFGRLRLREDPLHQPPIADLGPDPLLEMPTLRAFRSMLASRKGVTKGLLLNQAFLAGIGNWIADEVLFAARIAPQRRVNELQNDEVKALYQAIRRIIRSACDLDADCKRFPKHWLFHRRWGRPEDARTHDGREIQVDTVAGRSTAWVPALQV